MLAEARQLAARGVIELNLVAQDTTAYGLDQGGLSRLPDLLTRLAAVPGLRWLRVLYGHPAGVTPELLAVMAAHPQICPYFDLPLQHVNDRLLRRMGRGYTQSQIRDTVAHIRQVLPQATLRTSVIVGFPGETPEDFAELCRVTSELQFDHLGVFAFQPEEGTPAARLPAAGGRQGSQPPGSAAQSPPGEAHPAKIAPAQRQGCGGAGGRLQ